MNSIKKQVILMVSYKGVLGLDVVDGTYSSLFVQDRQTTY